MLSASWLQQWLALMGLYSPCSKLISVWNGFKFNLYHAQGKFNRQQSDGIFFFRNSLHEIPNPVFLTRSEKYFKMSSVDLFSDSATGMCNNYFCEHLNNYFCEHLMKYCRGESYYHTSFSKRINRGYQAKKSHRGNASLRELDCIPDKLSVCSHRW